MMFFVGGFIAVCCIGGGGVMCVAFGSLAWERQRINRRLDEIYLSAIAWQKCLDLAFERNDAVDQARCLEYLEALCCDAMNLLYVRDDGSEDADIVRDMVYANMTPEETKAKLAKQNRRNHEVYR